MWVKGKIRSLRQIKGLTVDELAKLSGLTKGYLSKIERSEKIPPVSTLQTICLALGVEFQEFFTASATPETDSPNLDIIRAGVRSDADSIPSEAGYSYRPLMSACFAEVCDPAIPYLRLPIQELARWCVESVMAQVNAPEQFVPRQQLVECEMILP